MPINPNGNGGTTITTFPWEDGETYFGRLVQIIDLGLQPGGEFNGEKKPDKEEVLWTFEFPEVLNEKGEPAWLSLFMKLPDRWESGQFKGIHVKANLYKYLNMMAPDLLYTGGANKSYVGFGRNFSWDKLIGIPLSFTVSVNDDGRAKITDASKVGKKFLDDVPPLMTEPLVVDMGSVTEAQWERVSNWIKKKIENSLDPSVANKAKSFGSNNQEDSSEEDAY